jgi:hypothetical protein
MWKSLFFLGCIAAALSGCDKSVGVGGSYRISAPFSPDGQHHGNSLYYNEQKVCDNVAMQQYHDGTLIFMGYVQETARNQLFAVSGAGPPVMLSERLVTDARAFVEPTMSGASKPGANYHLENLTPTPQGVRARFFVTVDEITGADVYEDHDLTWPEIAQLIQQGPKSGTLRNSKSGNYWFLAMKP